MDQARVSFPSETSYSVSPLHRDYTHSFSLSAYSHVYQEDRRDVSCKLVSRWLSHVYCVCSQDLTTLQSHFVQSVNFLSTSFHLSTCRGKERTHDHPGDAKPTSSSKVCERISTSSRQTVQRQCQQIRILYLVGFCLQLIDIPIDIGIFSLEERGFRTREPDNEISRQFS